MRRLQPLLTTALVLLFLAEAQRAFFASMFGLAYDALFPVLRPGPALLALLPFTALLAPLVPLPRWLDRSTALALAAIGAALFRLPMTHPALLTRLLGGALVLACAAAFLTWAVGHLERRAVAGGVVLGLVADQLLRHAGASYDLSLQPGYLPVQALLSLALVGLVVAGSGAEADSGVDAVGGDVGAGSELERRAGGLRLRGAMAFGALLFFELHVLGAPPVVARWTGVGYGLAAAAIGVAGALALALTLVLPRPIRGRGVALAAVAGVTAAALAGYGLQGVPVALGMAAGHLAVLLLVSRSLDPASGRRGGVMTMAGFLVFTVATALYALTFYAAFTVPVLDGATPWVLGAAGVVLAGCFVLLPRPGALEPVVGWVGGGAVGGVVALVALGLAAWIGDGQPRDGALEEPAGAVAVEGERPGTPGVRVVAWNVHYGFDEGWRFDPGAMAAALAEEDPDVVALQEALAGAPTAYGVDLPLWLGRRLGLRHHFSATINGLLGDAFLVGIEGRVDASPLPAGGGDRKQLLRLRAPVDGTQVEFLALHLGTVEGARPAQIAATLDRAGPGPTVILGDLNAEPGSPVIRRLRSAGFQDVFGDDATAGATFPARDPRIRIDWIWLRGLDSSAPAVLPATPSDHRAVAATLHIPDRRIRSTDDHDLQTP